MSERVPRSIYCAIIAIWLVTASACDSESRGFALPPGDPVAGKQTFIELSCTQCHSVINDIERDAAAASDVHFPLGGMTTRVRTYGDLVASIINPSHKISGYGSTENLTNDAGESKMRVYNDIMMVQQLIDLTAYLQQSYEVVSPPYTSHYGP